MMKKLSDSKLITIEWEMKKIKKSDGHKVVSIRISMGTQEIAAAEIIFVLKQLKKLLELEEKNAGIHPNKRH